MNIRLVLVMVQGLMGAYPSDSLLFYSKPHEGWTLNEEELSGNLGNEPTGASQFMDPDFGHFHK